MHVSGHDDGRAATCCRPPDLVENKSPGSSLSETELRERTLCGEPRPQTNERKYHQHDLH